MSLKDKTNALFEAAGAESTTPEEMKSMIAGLKSDPELVPTGAVLPMLQLALQVALMPGNDDASERRLGVIRVIAEALAEDYGREYIRFTLEQAKARGNSEGIIRKILDELRKGRQE